MKIVRPPLSNIPDSITEKTDTTGKTPGSVVEETAKDPVQIQRPLPKADSVEIKANSFYKFDNAPKLDPSQTNIANANVPPTVIPGVPFREKVELPKNLPSGQLVNSGLASGDLGLGKTHTGPNHMGIDMKGNEMRNQLDDALKLKGGSQSSSSAPSGSVVNPMAIGGSAGKTHGTYNAGFNRPGMDLISDKDGKSFGDQVKDAVDTVKAAVPKIIDKAIDYVKDVAVTKFGGIPGTGEGMTILDAPAKVKEVTGDEKDLVRGISSSIYPESRLDKIYQQGDDKYVAPDAPEGTQAPPITDDMLEGAKLRMDANKRPSGEDLSQGEIDGSRLSAADPRRGLISNPLPEDSNQSGMPSIDVAQIRSDAKGPDTVNPNDPDLGSGGAPIVIDPNRPK